MKTTKIIGIMLLSACTLFTISSCKKLKYYEFTDEDKTWINVYSKGDVIKFVSDTGDIRVYNVTSSTRGYIEDGKSYYSVADARLHSTDTIEAEKFSGSIKAVRNQFNFLFEINWPRHPLTAEITQQSPTSMTLGGITYNDIYVSDIPGPLDSINNVLTVYYSKTAGFVQYKEYNGQTWTRKN